MTTYTIFGNTADGKIDSTNAVYLTARSGGTLAVDTTGNLGHGQQEFFGYDVIQGFPGFDTSTVVGTISSVVFSLFGSGALNTAGWTSQARLSNWGPTVTTADFVAGASLGALTLLASKVLTVVGDWSTAGYNDYTSGANFLTNINQAGTTYFLLCNSKTVAGTAPASGTFENADSFSSDDAGTTRDPKLVVTTIDALPLLVMASSIPT